MTQWSHPLLVRASISVARAEPDCRTHRFTISTLRASLAFSRVAITSGFGIIEVRTR
jgi:hypothetical protein